MRLTLGNNVSDQLKGEPALNHIALISSSNSFHTTLLADFLRRQFDAECSIHKNEKKLPANTQLVLIDCLQSPMEDLERTLREISITHHTFSTALLNGEQNSEHETLLDWPFISGLFYIDTSEEQLIRGIQQILAGDYWVPRRLLHHVFNKHRQNVAGKHHNSQPLSIQLTNREREILRMIKDGMSNSEVSAALDLSEHTVKSHLYNIYKKIGVRNRMEASNWARDHQDLNSL